MNFNKSWAQFKALIDAGQIQWQYEESDDLYNLYGAQGPFTYTTTIMKDDGQDHTDFEANYKDNATTVIAVLARSDSSDRLGVFYYATGAFSVNSSADAATAGRGWLINPTDSEVTLRIRRIVFVCQITNNSNLQSAPRINIERVTFTGTASGATITPSKRKSTDEANVSSFRTASTGLSLSAGAVVRSFLPVATISVLTGIAIVGTPEQIFDPGPEDYIELAPGEGLVVRQADAGSTSDDRRYVVNFVVEEF